MGRFDTERPYIIALDFDGTVKADKVYNRDWQIWKPSPGFREFYTWALSQGFHLVLWTCRNMDDPYERIPVENFLEKYSLNEISLTFKEGAMYFHKGQAYEYWGVGSLKQYACFYVDDLAVGCPMLDCGTPAWHEIKRLISEDVGIKAVPISDNGGVQWAVSEMR